MVVEQQPDVDTDGLDQFDLLFEVYGDSIPLDLMVGLHSSRRSDVFWYMAGLQAADHAFNGRVVITPHTDPRFWRPLIERKLLPDFIVYPSNDMMLKDVEAARFSVRAANLKRICDCEAVAMLDRSPLAAIAEVRNYFKGFYDLMKGGENGNH
jgi:hypothetical protein